MQSITASSAPVTPGLRSLARKLFRYLECRRRARPQRADLSRLAHLSDHQLNDIGLTRDRVSVTLSRHLLL
jgi:uncharacterized protein YjiS (DUF1127 family)